MATTYYKKHKISKGETIAQSLKERFDYGQNPDKTEGGELISSYGCDHMTADAEFLLSKAKYKAATGREQRRDKGQVCLFRCHPHGQGAHSQSHLLQLDLAGLHPEVPGLYRLWPCGAEAL